MNYLQVHGGTTEDDIKKRVDKALDLARRNSQRYPNMYTVLFFDEANTTEALGMIKEVMCDHTVRGALLNGSCGLKIIAACNPYRK